MVTTDHRKKVRPPLTAAQVKALKLMAKRIDAEEGEAIKAKGREVFKRHGMAREVVAKLKSKRESAKVSLTELAARTGIAKSNLSRLENDGRNSPTLETLHRYAQALGMTVRVELN